MVKSSLSPTHNLLVALMNYTLDLKNTMLNQFTFASFYLNPIIIEHIIEYRNSDSPIHSVLLNQIELVEADYIIDNTHNNKAGFEHIKLDSISFFEEKPTFNGAKTLKSVGQLTCYPEFFILDIEWIPPGLEYPTLIYKSARFGYERINSLLLI
jgi:hypothetical protein